MSVLNKYLAHAGLASRRKATDLIQEGAVTVNGKVVKNPAYRVQEKDVVRYQESVIKTENKIYVLMNKPKDFITTVSDERGRKTVMDILQGEIHARVYPVGRLDRSTTGLLLLTNDGELMEGLAHPRNGIEKVYHVTLASDVSMQDIEKIRKGVRLEDGNIKVDFAGYLSGRPRNEVKIVLHSGKYRVVRRIFEHFDYQVKKLDRILYAGLTKKGLRIGQWRFLERYEIDDLKARSGLSV